MKKYQKMGKEGELWDDSALIMAFDTALDQYKKMHAKQRKDTSTEASAVTCETQVPETARDEDEKNNDATEFGVEENHCVDYSSSTQQQMQNICIDYSSSSQQQSQAFAESDYNKLVAEYNEVEEKRQRILQQLGSFDYQYSQTQTTCSAVCSCCCPYASHCPYGGSYQYPEAVQDPIKHASSNPTNGDIVQTAMDAAEKAIASLKIAEKEKEKGEDSIQNIPQSSTSETDLSVILNAWFSAGFYTGKYLTEQSLMKK